MRSIFEPREREKLHRRIAALRPASRPRWGRMTAPQMTCHLYDALSSSSSPSPSIAASGPLAYFPVKQLVIYVLPWPRGTLQSPPDLLLTQPGTWERDVDRLGAALDQVAGRGPAGEWPASEVFGRLSGAEWGALLRTHMNHHLRQFGV